ncbi:hypothetical protein ACQ4M4_18415 [Leptolyngbya sp. AN02str]
MKRARDLSTESLVTDWLPFVTKVLAFIGLWQVLTNSAAFLRHLF